MKALRINPKEGFYLILGALFIRGGTKKKKITTTDNRCQTSLQMQFMQMMRLNANLYFSRVNNFK